MPVTKLREYRKQLLTPVKILCTGNPNNPHTLAHGLRKLYPDATFVSQSLGWDLTATSDRFTELLQNHNIFVNSSYIAPGIQLNLLNIVADSWKFGHIINVGSSHEYTEDSEYARSKRELRDRSLALHTYRLRTSHIILGGLQDGTIEHTTWLNTDQVASAIKWIIEANFDVPVLGIEPEKQPW